MYLPTAKPAIGSWANVAASNGNELGNELVKEKLYNFLAINHIGVEILKIFLTMGNYN